MLDDLPSLCWSLEHQEVLYRGLYPPPCPEWSSRRVLCLTSSSFGIRSSKQRLPSLLQPLSSVSVSHLFPHPGLYFPLFFPHCFNLSDSCPHVAVPIVKTASPVLGGGVCTPARLWVSFCSFLCSWVILFCSLVTHCSPSSHMLSPPPLMSHMHFPPSPGSQGDSDSSFVTFCAPTRF